MEQTENSLMTGFNTAKSTITLNVHGKNTN